MWNTKTTQTLICDLPYMVTKQRFKPKNKGGKNHIWYGVNRIGKDMKRVSKNLRHTLFEQQNHACQLCSAIIEDMQHARYDKRLQYMLCIKCNFLILNHRDSQERGVTFDQIAAYENLDPQQPPDKLLHKLSLKQQEARRAVADGRVVGAGGHVMTVEEYDKRVGG